MTIPMTDEQKERIRNATTFTIVRVRADHDRRVLLVTTQMEGGIAGLCWVTRDVKTTGLLHDLLHPDTPVGIWIDRLEEAPEELVGVTPEGHREIVAYLRTKYSNGV